MGEVETPGVQKQEWLYTEPLGSRSGCGEGEARQMAFSIITCLLCVFFLNTLFNFYLFIYLFLAVLCLRFCARAFSSCGKWGPLFTVCGPLTIAASLVAEHRLQTHRLSNAFSVF